jgi:hypothetical protein
MTLTGSLRWFGVSAVVWSMPVELAANYLIPNRLSLGGLVHKKPRHMAGEKHTVKQYRQGNFTQATLIALPGHP